MKKLLIGIAKVIGVVWVFACIPFRKYARSVVHNYVLNNDKREWLSRLWQRNPKWDSNLQMWHLQDVHNVKRPGYIHYRKVGKLQFYFVVFVIYGWLDDDSNEDTTDLRVHIKSCIDGEHKDELLSKLFRRQLKKIDINGVVYGNSFDLGDVRSHYPFYNFAATFVWNTRNSAMNFQYLFNNY